MLMVTTDRSDDVCIVSLKSPIADQHAAYRLICQKTEPKS